MNKAMPLGSRCRAALIALTLLCGRSGLSAPPEAGRLAGHSGPVRAMAYSPDGRLLATGGPGAILLWDPGTGKEVRAIPVTGSPGGLTFDSSGKQLLSSPGDSSRKVVSLWDVENGKLLQELKRLPFGISTTQFTNNGKALLLLRKGSNHRPILKALGSETTEEIQLGNAEERKLDHRGISPDGKQILTVDLGQAPKKVRLWDLDTKKQIWSVELPPRAVLRCHSFGANGKYVALGLSTGLQVWDHSAKKKIFEKAELKDMQLALLRSDGNQIAVRASAAEIQIWDLTTGKMAHAHPGALVAFSPDNGSVAIASRSDIAILSTTDWKAQQSLAGNVATAVAFGEHDKRIATGYQGRVHIRDRQTRLSLRSFQVHKGNSTRGVAYSENGKWILSVGTESLTSSAHEVSLCDALTGKVVRVISRHRNLVPLLAFTSGDAIQIVLSDGAATQVYDRELGKKIFEVKTLSKLFAISPDNKYLAVVRKTVLQAPGTIHIYELQTGKEVAALKGTKETARALTYLPDGKAIQAFTTGRSPPSSTITTWNPDKPEAPSTLQPLRGKQEDRGRAPLFSPDGSLLVLPSGSTSMDCYDARTGRKLLRIAKALLLPGVDISSKGDLLATCSGGVTLHRLAFVRLAAKLDGHKEAVLCLGYSPDGKYIATGGIDKRLLLWNAQTGKKIRELTGKPAKGSVHCLCFYPNGKRIAIAHGPYGRGNSVVLYDVAGGPEKPTPFTIRAGFPGGTGQPLNHINRVQISPNGKLLATAESNGSIRICDATTGRTLSALPRQRFSVDRIAFHPDGKRLLSCSFNRITIWDLEEKTSICTIKGDFGYVRALAFSPNGKELAAGSMDGILRVWQTVDQKLLQKTEIEEKISSVRFHPNGKYLAVGSGNLGKSGTVQIFRIGDGKTVSRIDGFLNPVTALAFHPSGRYFATAAWNDSVIVWKLPFAQEEEKTDKP